jgi:hypothetical protein
MPGCCIPPRTDFIKAPSALSIRAVAPDGPEIGNLVKTGSGNSLWAMSAAA